MRHPSPHNEGMTGPSTLHVDFQRLFEESPQGVAVLGIDGRLLRANRALRELIGVREAELLDGAHEETKRAHELVGGPRRLAGLAAGEVDELLLERRLLRPDGTAAWIRVRCTPLRDEHGRAVQIVLQTEDVTRVKTIELERRWLQNSQEAGRIGSWELDLESGAQRWSREQYDLYGVDSSGPPPALDTLLALIHPEDRHTWLESMRDHMASGAGFIDEFRVLHPTLGARALVVRGRYLPRDQEAALPARLAGTTHDVTAERAAEALAKEALINTERRLSEAQALAHVGSSDRDVSSPRAVLSPELCRILGQPLGFSPTDDEFLTLVHEDDREVVEQAVRDAVGGIPSDYEYRVVRPDGEIRYLHALSHQRRDGEGNVTHRFAAIQDITERVRYEEELRRLATHDALTGLPNRRTFDKRIADEIGRAERHRHGLSLALIDVDHFKRINDTLGHPVGDRVLAHIAHALHEMVREHELIARVGGEEFAWILPEADGTGALAAVRRGLANVTRSHTEDGLRITLSAGICTMSEGVDATELYRRADNALLAAKHEGRDRIFIYGEDWTEPESAGNLLGGPATKGLAG